MYLNSHKTMIKLWAQLESAEWTLKFPKRCSVAFSPERNAVDESLKTGFSVGFLQKLHDLALAKPGHQPYRCGPDEYAATMLCSVRRAVHDWLNPKIDSCGKVDLGWAVKLAFCKTDITRYAQVNKHVVQFCCALSVAWQGRMGDKLAWRHGTGLARQSSTQQVRNLFGFGLCLADYDYLGFLGPPTAQSQNLTWLTSIT
jgi:hypothetical protein